MIAPTLEISAMEKEISQSVNQSDLKDLGASYVYPQDKESISKATGIPVEKIKDVEVYYDKDYVDEISPKYLGSLKITSGPREAWGSSHLSKDYYTGGSGGANVSHTYNEQFNFTQSNTLKLGTSEVSAELGFGSSITYSKSKTFSSKIPAGKSGYLYVYPIYDAYSFNIYNLFGSKTGSGNCLRPIGLGFVSTW